MRYAGLALVLLLPALAGCDLLRRDPTAATLSDTAAPPPDMTRPAPRPEAGAPATRITPAGARSADAFDRSTEAERAAARATPAEGRELGKVVVSLGSPAEQGFWLRSALVAAPGPGVVRLAADRSVNVDLRPVPVGGAAQLSLAAYRALGLGLTDLPEVTVLAR